MEEEWRDIRSYEGLYQVSNLGNVKSFNNRIKNKNPMILKQTIDRKNGYLTVSLSKNGKKKIHRVHKLVASIFIDNPNNYPVINHKDGNKLNNCVDNLEWCTCQENIDHAVKMNLRADQRGENNPYHKITEQQAKEIIDLLLSKKYTQLEISRMYGLSDDYAGNIKRKKLWKYLTKDIDFS